MQFSCPFGTEPIAHSNAGYDLGGFSQKTIIVGRTMIMWAGRFLIARVLIGQIVEASNNGRDKIDVRDVLRTSGFGPDEAREVSIIYHYLQEDGGLFRTATYCEFYQEHGQDVAFGSGGGVWNFFKNLRLDGATDLLKDYQLILANYITKISHHAIAEKMGTDTLDYLYGGWFEITKLADDGFRKVPHAVKFWSRKDGILGSGGPAYYGWYGGHCMYVLRFQLIEKAPGEISSIQQITQVPDFLNRGGYIGPPAKPVRPEIITHVVSDHDTLKMEVFVETDPTNEDMIIEVSQAGPRMAWTPALSKWLLNLNREKPDWNIRQNFS
jgi:hypothetical protein